jgi:hypothetical protein
MSDEGRAMEATEKFERAEDQAAAAVEMRDELFFDEGETYWVVAEGRTAEGAVALISNIEPEAERPEARIVYGWLGTRYGQSWFSKDSEGPVQMWQVGP